MLFRKQIGNWVLILKFIRVAWTEGLTSTLTDGSHILMWETDDATLEQFCEELETLQSIGQLPTIYIFQSSPTKGYHAICFQRSTWQEAVCAACAVPSIDMTWVRWALMRGCFTLRTGKKNGHEPEPVAILKSMSPESVKIEELENWVRYQIVNEPATR